MFDALVLAGLIAWKLGCLIGLSVVCQYFDKSDKLLTSGAAFKKKHADTYRQFTGFLQVSVLANMSIHLR